MTMRQRFDVTSVVDCSKLAFLCAFVLLVGLVTEHGF